MARNPAVSIIIAAYNAQDHIGGAIASALAQKDVEVEVIVADDASSDATCDVVTAIGDERVRLIKLNKNGGPSAARNAAFKVARGDWLAVLDADDSMTDCRISTLLAFAQEGQADIVADNLIVDREGDRSLFIDEVLDGGAEILDLPGYVHSNIVFKKQSNYGYLKPMFRTQFLRKHSLSYDINLRIGEDFLLAADFLAFGAVYKRRRSADYIYMVHSGSISHRLSAANALAMVAADQAFLSRHGSVLAADGARAMRAHIRGLEDAASIARLVAAIKAGQWGRVLAEGIQHPSALRLLMLPLKARLGRQD